MGTTRTVLAAVGDVHDMRTWSGIPFHALQAGRAEGLIDAGLALRTTGAVWRLRRIAWNLSSILRGRGAGGYQYSVRFLEELWSAHRHAVANARVINCFQLYPPSLVEQAGMERWYFLDQTLLQLFDHYGIRSTIGRSIARDALEREREGYQRASGIVMHSRWAAASVVRDYGIAPAKVAVVVPGANIDHRASECSMGRHRAASPREGGPLRLVFVGRNPARKGLDRLLRAFRIARSRGAKCALRVIGCAPGELPKELRTIPGVEWLGFVDKWRDAARFLQAVGECDVGCLLSRAEAGGIGLREYHALGLAVIGPDVGGSPDHVIREAAELVSPDASDEEIAELLVNLAQDRDRVQRMRDLSWEHRAEMHWSASMRHLAQEMGRADR
jgi:glycosyltransferase involved in cell wall biosynthesis